MIPYSRPKLSDLYTLSQSKLRFENHTLHSGTYLYSPYMVVPPPPGAGSLFERGQNKGFCIKSARERVTFFLRQKGNTLRLSVMIFSQSAKAGRKAEIGNVLSMVHFLFVYLFAYEF